MTASSAKDSINEIYTGLASAIAGTGKPEPRVLGGAQPGANRAGV